MGCSIIGDTIKVMVKGANQFENGDASSGLFGSALQNPEMSRLQLDSILRHGQGKSSAHSKRSVWSSLLNQQQASFANTNEIKS